MIEHIEQGTLPAHVKACIALTSWKKRINTVGLTIYNLFETCGPDYHIVLTLAEEEFPKKEQELPRDLVLMNKAGMFEILWCKRNLKSFKKWFYCAARYPKVPVISADDDCLYNRNYAAELYNAWLKNQWCCYTIHKCPVTGFQHGPASLYPPANVAEFMLSHVTDSVLQTAHDDVFIGMCLNKLNIPIIEIDNTAPYVFHDTVGALSDGTSMNVFSAMEAISHEIR